MAPPAARSPDQASLQQQQRQQQQQQNATELDALLPLHNKEQQQEIASRERLDSIEAVNKALALSIGEVEAPDEAASGQWFRCAIRYDTSSG